MLAKAVATEGGATFLSVDASSIENKWLGESEKNAKAVFTLARRLAPCVIFIDEVDSILSSREGSSDDSAHGTLTSVKTTMMVRRCVSFINVFTSLHGMYLFFRLLFAIAPNTLMPPFSSPLYNSKCGMD